MPVQVLLEQEERVQPDGERGVHAELVAERVDRFGQHVEQRTAEQRPSGERDQGQDELLERRLGDHERQASRERQRAHGDARRDDPSERRHLPTDGTCRRDRVRVNPWRRRAGPRGVA
jgi:hypothetical protein